MSWDSPAAEAAELLRTLLRFNTVNPPGNEREAQEFLAAHLTEAGFECELLGAEPGRPNLVARLPSAGDPSAGQTLCYLGHVDTVLADRPSGAMTHGRAMRPTASYGAEGRST